MKKFTKAIAAIILLTTAVIFATGCGNNSANSQKKDETRTKEISDEEEKVASQQDLSNSNSNAQGIIGAASKVYSNAYDGYANIRQTPESGAPVVGMLCNGPEGAILLGTEGEWKKIDCNGVVGYVYEKYIQDTPTEVLQTTSVNDNSQEEGKETEGLEPDPDYGGHDYVDLGLPSGTLWATCNIGANAPEEYGCYFAWGETKPKTTYDWSTYKHCNGDIDQQIKYCNNSQYGNNGFTDNSITLELIDDAATANWGNGWTIPTEKQWWELRDNTTRQFTVQNGVKGLLFTSKKNGQCLFLPAAGYRFHDELKEVDSGNYWSSSPSTDVSYGAEGFYFSSSFSASDGNIARAYGRSVRPVRSAR